jgi:hypothetical protein
MGRKRNDINMVATIVMRGNKSLTLKKVELLAGRRRGRISVRRISSSSISRCVDRKVRNIFGFQNYKFDSIPKIVWVGGMLVGPGL